jgi:hypothetical protein
MLIFCRIETFTGIEILIVVFWLVILLGLVECYTAFQKNTSPTPFAQQITVTANITLVIVKNFELKNTTSSKSTFLIFSGNFTDHFKTSNRMMMIARNQCILYC